MKTGDVCEGDDTHSDAYHFLTPPPYPFIQKVRSGGTQFRCYYGVRKSGRLNRRPTSRNKLREIDDGALHSNSKVIAQVFNDLSNPS